MSLCLLVTAGALYSWGMGSNNQLGLGEEDDQDVPIKVAGKQLETRSVVAHFM